ncbi:tetratricopeptide repeat protein [Acidicapsa dinghuensis]|uniref:Tetratricopeptide repeat protein n=1 Tax=Acidicapsa dinghuensis TaxID=2218256 RepID=A0ABW1EKV4_9BACT|nr:hypothetical protein [Acidicapsa dinghuensis]
MLWSEDLVAGVLGLALVVYLLAIPKFRLYIARTSHKGQFERALKMDEFFSRFPFYGASLRGLIVVLEGRYAYARAFLKPRAFDRHGKPLFLTPEFRWYMVALINDGSPEMAQPLLEEAIRQCRPALEFRRLLVSCLLDQGTDPGRACELIEYVLKEQPEKLTDERYPAIAASRLSLYARALAACGRSSEARAEIEEALKRLPTLHYWEIARLQYSLGEAWDALGEFEEARRAFQLSIDILPTGAMAIASRKALARMM